MAWVSRGLLRLLGWRLIGGLPDHDKYVIIFYPHTSNWDFVLGILACFALKLDVSFLGKHTLFAGPFGWLFRALGGYPVKRHERKNMVSQVVELIESKPTIALAIAPEGTRSKTDHWKSGFYHIARAADVPVALAYLDSKTHTMGIGPSFRMSGDVEADLDAMRAFYVDKYGIRPELASEISFRP